MDTRMQGKGLSVSTSTAVLIVVNTAAVIISGLYFYRLGYAWRQGLTFPWYMPPDAAVITGWIVVYVLMAYAAFLSFRRQQSDDIFSRVVLRSSFFVNALLNFFLHYVFFIKNHLDWSFAYIVCLTISGISLFLVLNSYRKRASFFLVPYVLWTGFITKLVYDIWRLNG